MKNVFLFCWMLLGVTYINYGQVNNGLQNNNWVFGTRNTLRFRSAPATDINQSPLYSYAAGSTPIVPGGPNFNVIEGCASVSNRLGNLLFYTDGMAVFNDSNNLITDPIQTLIGNISSAQNVIIIPVPNSNTRFYLVNIVGETLSPSPTSANLLNRGLYFSEIETAPIPPQNAIVNLNEPLNDLNGIPFTSKTAFNPRNDNNLSEAITSTLHNDGKSYWLVACVKATMAISQNIEDKIISYRVTEAGITPVFETAIPNASSGFIFGVKISPNGNRIAITTNDNGVYTGDFNNATGTITFTNQITRGGGFFETYGLEFSPDSNILYYTGRFESSDLTVNENFLVRYNLSNNTAETTTDLQKEFVGLQRGIDDRIYLSGGGNNNNELQVIADPNNDNNSNDIDLTILSLNRVLGSGLPQWVWKQSCETSLIDNEDIPGTYTVEEQRSEWIQCVNRVSNNSRGIYHAGNFIELLPENGTNLGFEAEFGSQFSAYIADCSEPFVYKQSTTSSNTQSEKSNLKPTTPKIELHPNPVNDLLHIDAIGMNITQIQISSIEGKRIQTLNANSNQETIDVRNFSNGMYLISIQTDDGQTITKKFLKN